ETKGGDIPVSSLISLIDFGEIERIFKISFLCPEHARASKVSMLSNWVD
ncbi:MAG: hypothetical protein PWQ40_810, partial [Archaeoglobus sp.]|nr:hypothetical protein [Archaeoglobus sp.]